MPLRIRQPKWDIVRQSGQLNHASSFPLWKQYVSPSVYEQKLDGWSLSLALLNTGRCFLAAVAVGGNPEVCFLKQYGMWQTYCSINFTKKYLFHFAVPVSKYSFGAIAVASLAFCVPLAGKSSTVVSLGLCLEAAERHLSVPRCRSHAASVPPASEALVALAPLCSGGTSWRCSVEEHFLHINPDGEPRERERERGESFIKATVTWSS